MGYRWLHIRATLLQISPLNDQIPTTDCPAGHSLNTTPCDPGAPKVTVVVSLVSMIQNDLSPNSIAGSWSIGAQLMTAPVNRLRNNCGRVQARRTGSVPAEGRPKPCTTSPSPHRIVCTLPAPDGSYAGSRIRPSRLSDHRQLLQSISQRRIRHPRGCVVQRRHIHAKQSVYEYAGGQVGTRGRRVRQICRVQ